MDYRRYINTKEDSMSKYLKDVRKSEQITPQQEIEIAKRIAAGDEKAIDELVMANLRFVIAIAKEYQNQGMRVVRAFLLCNSHFISFLFVRGRYKPDMNVIML